MRSDASQPFVSTSKTLTLPKRKIEDFFPLFRVRIDYLAKLAMIPPATPQKLDTKYPYILSNFMYAFFEDLVYFLKPILII